MKQKYTLEIVGFFVIIALGVVTHFTYEWLDNSKYIAIFVPVNESIFEHLKMLFFPYVIWSIIQYIIVPKRECNYIWAHILAVFVGMLFIIISYYSYEGIIGYDIVIIDIIIYIISVFITIYMSYHMTCALPFNDNLKVIAAFLLLFIIICFIIYSYNPPRINLFKDPLTGNYGAK